MGDIDVGYGGRTAFLWGKADGFGHILKAVDLDLRPSHAALQGSCKYGMSVGPHAQCQQGHCEQGWPVAVQALQPFWWR